MGKPAIHLKYNNSRVTSFFDVLGKANHRPYCTDEVILTRSDDLVQPTIGWSSYTKETLSSNGWAMEQLTLLQNQFPVEEVKIDITFKYKLFIYNIYKHM